MSWVGCKPQWIVGSNDLRDISQLACVSGKLLVFLEIFVRFVKPFSWGPRYLLLFVARATHEQGLSGAIESLNLVASIIKGNLK